MTIQASAIYREGPLIAQDYLDAIEDLRNAMDQLAPDGRNCTVCGDSDHQAFECRHNPLVMARRCVQYTFSYWRCFHCGAEFFKREEASEHFGIEKKLPPACLTDVHKLIALMKAAVELAIIRHGLANPEYEESDLADNWREQVAGDAADAVRGVGACAEEPVAEWKAIFAPMVVAGERG